MYDLKKWPLELGSPSVTRWLLRHCRHKPRIWCRRPLADAHLSTTAGPCAMSLETRDVLRPSDCQRRGHPAGRSRTMHQWSWGPQLAPRSYAGRRQSRDDRCCAGWERWVVSTFLFHCYNQLARSAAQIEFNSIQLYFGWMEEKKEMKIKKDKTNTQRTQTTTSSMIVIQWSSMNHKQESLADAKVSARQQCVYEDP